MLVVGAKGFAKDILEVFINRGEAEELVFFDDVSVDLPRRLYDRFPVIRSIDELQVYFQSHSKAFVLGVGNPRVRKFLAEKICAIGGDLQSSYCSRAYIGTFGVRIESGVAIMTNAIVSNDVFIGKGCLINYNTYVAHDCRIGEFSELCPGVHVLGRCNIGSHVFIGAGATILPDVVIGDNVIIGAGAVVTKSVAAGVVVAGVPAEFKRRL